MTVKCFLGCVYPSLRVKLRLPVILRVYEILFRTPKGERNIGLCTHGSMLINGQWLFVVGRVLDGWGGGASHSTYPKLLSGLEHMACPL